MSIDELFLGAPDDVSIIQANRRAKASGDTHAQEMLVGAFLSADPAERNEFILCQIPQLERAAVAIEPLFEAGWLTADQLYGVVARHNDEVVALNRVILLNGGVPEEAVQAFQALAADWRQLKIDNARPLKRGDLEYVVIPDLMPLLPYHWRYDA